MVKSTNLEKKKPKSAPSESEEEMESSHNPPSYLLPLDPEDNLNYRAPHEESSPQMVIEEDEVNHQKSSFIDDENEDHQFIKDFQSRHQRKTKLCAKGDDAYRKYRCNKCFREFGKNRKACLAHEKTHRNKGRIPLVKTTIDSVCARKTQHQLRHALFQTTGTAERQVIVSHLKILEEKLPQQDKPAFRRGLDVIRLKDLNLWKALTFMEDNRQGGDWIAYKVQLDEDAEIPTRIKPDFKPDDFPFSTGFPQTDYDKLDSADEVYMSQWGYNRQKILVSSERSSIQRYIGQMSPQLFKNIPETSLTSCQFYYQSDQCSMIWNTVHAAEDLRKIHGDEISRIFYDSFAANETIAYGISKIRDDLLAKGSKWRKAAQQKEKSLNRELATALNISDVSLKLKYVKNALSFDKVLSLPPRKCPICSVNIRLLQIFSDFEGQLPPLPPLTRANTQVYSRIARLKFLRAMTRKYCVQFPRLGQGFASRKAMNEWNRFSQDQIKDIIDIKLSRRQINIMEYIPAAKDLQQPFPKFTGSHARALCIRRRLVAIQYAVLLADCSVCLNRQVTKQFERESMEY